MSIVDATGIDAEMDSPGPGPADSQVTDIIMGLDDDMDTALDSQAGADDGMDGPPSSDGQAGATDCMEAVSTQDCPTSVGDSAEAAPAPVGQAGAGTGDSVGSGSAPNDLIGGADGMEAASGQPAIGQ